MKKISNLWVLSTAVFAGCSSGDSPKLAEYEVRDSAGIESHPIRPTTAYRPGRMAGDTRAGSSDWRA